MVSRLAHETILRHASIRLQRATEYTILCPGTRPVPSNSSECDRTRVTDSSSGTYSNLSVS